VVVGRKKWVTQVERGHPLLAKGFFLNNEWRGDPIVSGKIGGGDQYLRKRELLSRSVICQDPVRSIEKGGKKTKNLLTRVKKRSLGGSKEKEPIEAIEEGRFARRGQYRERRCVGLRAREEGKKKIVSCQGQMQKGVL